MNSIFRLTLLQAVFGLLRVSAAQAESDQELLEFVRDAHRAARDSIQSFSCRVEFTIAITAKTRAPITQSCSSRYWCSPKAMRARISENNEDTDFLWDNSIQKYVTRREIGGQPAARAGRDRFTHRHIKRCDPFVRGLLVLNLPNTIDCMPFEELVERATKFKKAKRERVNGKELIVVQLIFDTPKESKPTLPAWTVDIYFDPAVNYLIRQVIYTEQNYRREDEILEFKEHQPGLFFPELTAGRSQVLPSEAKYSEHKTKFSDIQINQPLSKDFFNFKYPHGVFLSDSIRGCEYRVDADGNQISQATPLGREPPPPGNAGDVKHDFGAETQTEPRTLSHWILPISFGILIAGGVAAFLRRRRRQAESA